MGEDSVDDDEQINIHFSKNLTLLIAFPFKAAAVAAKTKI